MALNSAGPLLITGSSGLLGAHLATAFAARGKTIGIDRHSWWGHAPVHASVADIAEPDAIERVIAETAPSIIVHTAAMVNVDGCEHDPVGADRMNGELTRRVARAARPGTLVVYITTDGIFSGTFPWATERHFPCPRTAYGRSKLRGEWEVQLATPDHLIVRTNFFGWSGGRKLSSAEWLYNALQTRTPITAFDDFFFTPIYVVDFVERLLRLVDGEHRGIFHLAGRDRVSKYDFALAMAKAADVAPVAVSRGSIEDAHLPADRPRDMSLSSDHFCEATGMDVPGCAEGLRRFLEDRHRSLDERLGSLSASNQAAALRLPE